MQLPSVFGAGVDFLKKQETPSGYKTKTVRRVYDKVKENEGWRVRNRRENNRRYTKHEDIVAFIKT